MAELAAAAAKRSVPHVDGRGRLIGRSLCFGDNTIILHHRVMAETTWPCREPRACLTTFILNLENKPAAFAWPLYTRT